MIKYFSCTQGEYVTGKGNNYASPKGNTDFLCLFLENPSEAEELQVCKQLKFNSKHFLNYKKAVRSMRYSMKPLAFVLLDYYTENKRIKSTRILFLVKKRVMIIVSPHKSNYHSNLFDELASKLKLEKKKESQLAYFFYYFLYEDARGNYEVLDELENRIFAIEEEVKNISAKPTFIDQIVKLKRQCFKMSRHFWASARLIFTIKRGLTPLTLGKELGYLMDDVYDTFVHQTDLLTTEREILTDLLEIYSTSINNRLTTISNDLNKVMKKLTALTVILMVPTLITGFYGMNFRYMPELQLPYGYVLVSIAMIIISVSLYFYFHKKDWV